MRNFDFSPLYRSTVGFDQLADLMDRVFSNDVGQSTYPPFNIEKTAENAYRISLAVAGFAPEDLAIEQRETELVVSARKAGEDDGRTYLYRGIAERAFEKRFHLADHVKVTGALHENGMLHVELAREVPEALKPRRIEIARATAPAGKVLENKAA